MAARPAVALTSPGSAAPISSSPVSRKTAPITPTAGISATTSHKYSSGLPALAYDTVDDLLAQIGAARREVSKRNYQIAIEEAALAPRAMESEDQLSALRPLLVEQIGCASRIYDEVRQVVSLVDPDAAGALPDSVFVWKEADVEESLRVSLEGTRMALDIASMALHKVGAWRDSRNTKVSELELRVEELVREKEHIGVLLRSALQANTSEVLKVTEDGLREAGIDISLNNGHRDHRRPGSAHKDDEVYTLEGALETSIKESQIKIIELQHLVQAQRAESGLLRTRMEGQEKEIGQLRRQIKHLEEKERVANDSVEGLMMDVAAAQEEIKIWKMAAEEESHAGRSIEQEFQIQASLFAMASELGSPTRAAERTIMDLGDDLLREIFVRLPSLPSLVRAALACPTFLHAVRSSPAFRRRFQSLHPPQLLGFFCDHRSSIPFFPLRGRCDRDHTAVISRADFLFTRLTEDSAHYPHWWEIQSCHGGYVILVNMVLHQIATYNPLTQALHIFPFPPAKFGCGGAIEFHIIFSEEDLGVFRMVCVVHRKTPTCIAVISSATMKWTRVPQPDDGGEDMNFNLEFDQGRQVNALVYWKHLRQDYALVLNTTTLQISRVDMPLGGKGSKLGHSKDGQLCMVGTDDSVAHIGNLFVWVWRAADDDVEKWILEYTRPLSTLVRGSLTTDVTVHVEAVIDGFVYLRANAEEDVSLLSLCLETEELNTLFDETYANLAAPYFMAWPLSLICNKVGKLAKSRNKRKRRKYAKNPPKAYPPLYKVGKLLRARIRKRQRDGKMLRTPQKHTLNL